jgi:hypothetical protein
MINEVSEEFVNSVINENVTQGTWGESQKDINEAIEDKALHEMFFQTLLESLNEAEVNSLTENDISELFDNFCKDLLSEDEKDYEDIENDEEGGFPINEEDLYNFVRDSLNVLNESYDIEEFTDEELAQAILDNLGE